MVCEVKSNIFPINQQKVKKAKYLKIQNQNLKKITLFMVTIVTKSIPAKVNAIISIQNEI